MEHELKCDKAYFDCSWRGEKPFELRFNDRNFQKGDRIILRETTSHGVYGTGRKMEGVITCVISGPPWLKEGYVALGMSWDALEKDNDRTEFE